jgi:hypothetical protein
MSQRPVERPRHPCEVQRIDEQPCVPDLPTAAAAFERDGELWERATWATIAGWIGLLVTRVIIIAAATIVGATLAASASSIPLMLAVTLATQMIVVGQRAKETGLAIPSRSRHRRMRRAGR